MNGSLIIGGTRGLGRELALESLHRNRKTLVVGRNTEEAKQDPLLRGAEFRSEDMRAEGALFRAVRGRHAELSTFFWTVGSYVRRPIPQTSWDHVRELQQAHFLGLVDALQALRYLRHVERLPFRLVVVGSTSSWRICRHESVYGSMQAAKAHFVRHFAAELRETSPGSRVTLVNLSGLKSDRACRERGLDPGSCMTRPNVARIIWEEFESQSGQFLELNVLRRDDWTPDVVRGTVRPESP